MIFNSILITSIVDGLVIGVVLAGFGFATYRRREIKFGNAILGTVLIGMGLLTLGGFHIYNLALMHIFPSFMSKIEAFDLMRDLHLDWIVHLIATGLIIGGSIALVLRLMSRTLTTEASERRFQDLANTAADRFWETSADFQYIYVSDPKGNLSNPVENLIGRRPWEVVGSNKNLPGLVELKKKFENHLPVDNIEYHWVTPSGEQIHIVISATPYWDESGRFNGYRGVSINKTPIRKAQQNYRQIFEQANDGILLRTIDSRVLIDCNKVFLANLGYSKEELIGEPIQIFSPLPHVSARDVRIAELAPGDSDAVERIHRRKDGTEFPVEISSSTVTVDGQSLMLSVVRDITVRKRAETALRESEDRFRDFAETSSDWFWEMDENLRFKYMSDRFFALSGVRPEDLVGKTRKESGLNMEDEHVRRNIADLEAHRPFKNFEHSRVHPDGSDVFMSTSGMPIFDDNGVFKGYRGTGTDITERKEAEKALQSAHDELELRIHERTAQLREEIEERKRIERHLVESSQHANTANRTKTEFLANMSHELRTPLNTIIGFSETLSKKVFGPLSNKKQEEYIDDIHDSGQHLLNLINDILDVSAIETGKLELSETEVDINDVAKASLLMVKTRAEEGGVELINTIDGRCHIIRADERRMKQILVNLLSNAVKFTRVGGTVNIGAETNNDGSTTIFVTDTGIGMSVEEISKAMELFGQVHHDDNRELEGTGLGLPLTKKLVEAQGGTLFIESEPNIGTNVKVQFPKDRIAVST